MATVTRDRQTRLGASDIATLLNLNPYTTEYTLHLEKTGQLHEWTGNDATEDGQLFEPLILTRAEQRLGKLERDVFLPCPNGNPIGATLDGLLVGSNEVIEAKTTGLGDRPIVGYWGSEGTAEIPEQYLVQVQVQMHCAQAQVAHVAAWVGHRGIRYYRVERDQEVIDQLVEMSCRWWQRHVVEGIAPSANNPPDLEVFKRLRRQPAKAIDLKAKADKLIERMNKAKEKVAKSKESQEKIQSQLLLLLKDAEQGTTPSGTVVSYFEYERKGYTVQPSKYRTLKISKAKESR